MPRAAKDAPAEKPRRAVYSIEISEWDASAGRFEEKRLELTSRVIFRMSTGHEVELKFSADGSALDVRSQGTLSVSPVAANMILIGHAGK